MDRLQEILDNKRREIEVLHETYQPDLNAMQRPRPPFIQALKQGPNLAVIAELKPRSPSQGDLNTAMDVTATATLFEQSGASALSVLTDRKYFGGSMGMLQAVSQTVSLPLLCKEFILDPFQIDLARENGASAVLLISDILDDMELLSLYHYARDMEMDVLLEAHHPENIERCAELHAPLIGINNRNLRSFEIDLEHSLRVSPLLPEQSVRLSLSAVNSPEDVQRLSLAGYDGVLVGSSLMQSKDPGTLLHFLCQIPRSRYLP